MELDEDDENEDVLIDTPLGSYNDQNSLPDDTSDFKSGKLEDSNKPINVSLIYFGGTETLAEKLPISKKIYAGKFVINLIIKKSNVRGSIIVRYNTCKLWWKN